MNTVPELLFPHPGHAAAPVVFALPSPQATADLAEWLALRLVPGDVLLLEGEIGAGKTHFARKLIQARLATVGRFEDVPSPTFTLVQVYDAGGTEIWHSDLYRLTSADEAVELGLAEAFETAICLVEWPDRLGGMAPARALRMRFSDGPEPDSRLLALSFTELRWGVLIDALPLERLRNA